jgi:hypothetical protein
VAIYVSPAMPVIVEGEVLTGPIDGINKVFTTIDKFSMVFSGPQIKVYFNGVRQLFPDDYTVSESVPGLGFDTVTFAVAPRTRDNLLADYEVAVF